MSQAIEISEKEKLENLAEEIRAILTEAVFSARMTLLEAKHLAGKVIMESLLYKKWGKGSGKLVEEIAGKIGRSTQELYLCCQFYQKFPVVSQVVETLKGKKNDIRWSDVRKLLEPKKPKHTCQDWEKVERCVICRKLKT